MTIHSLHVFFAQEPLLLDFPAIPIRFPSMAVLRSTLALLAVLLMTPASGLRRSKPTTSNSCSSPVGHCGRAYQACCIGFGADGHPCDCKLADGEGKAGANCGTCGTGYAACCLGYKLTGNPCFCDVA